MPAKVVWAVSRQRLTSCGSVLARRIDFFLLVNGRVGMGMHAGHQTVGPAQLANPVGQLCVAEDGLFVEGRS